MDARTYTRPGGHVDDVATISTRGMVLQKRLFPLASVLALVVIFVVLRHTWPANTILLPAAIILSLAVSILNWVMLVRQADDVIDAGDHLIVRKSDQQVRIPLRDVTTVSASFWGVTLQVSPSMPLGSTIRFSPQRALGRGAVVMSLRTRSQAAKRA